jgi:hypothetical protein
MCTLFPEAAMRLALLLLSKPEFPGLFVNLASDCLEIALAVSNP